MTHHPSFTLVVVVQFAFFAIASAILKTAANKRVKAGTPVAASTKVFGSLAVIVFAFCSLSVRNAAGQSINVTVDPAQSWIGYMNWQPTAHTLAKYPADGGTGNSVWGTSDLRANLNASGLATLLPNTNTYNPGSTVWVNPDGTGANQMDANFYVQNDGLAGDTVTFSGTLVTNSLVAPYSTNTTAFIKDFSSGYSLVGSVTTNLLIGGAFSITLATAVGDHIQYGFEMFGPDASPTNTVATLGEVLVSSNPPAATAPPPPAATQWNIVWDDEFNGTAINTNVWTFETGNGGSNPGWGNSEQEYYTSRTNNAYEAGGLLHIVAQSESYNGFSFTSARMKTQGLYATPTYGRFVWRARLPQGTGMWPALWMMGTNFPSVGWPDCGEMDVVENNGGNPTFVQGSLHSPYGNPTDTTSCSVTDFHVYTLDWESNSISWSVDGVPYETQAGGAPFNAPFFFIMNLAVGGTYVGTTSTSQIEAGTVFPQEMQVDYLRVYELTQPLQVSMLQNSSGQSMLAWPTNIVCHLQAQTNSSGFWSDLPVTNGPFVLPVSSGNSQVLYRLESP